MNAQDSLEAAAAEFVALTREHVGPVLAAAGFTEVPGGSGVGWTTGPLPLVARRRLPWRGWRRLPWRARPKLRPEVQVIFEAPADEFVARFPHLRGEVEDDPSASVETWVGLLLDTGELDADIGAASVSSTRFDFADVQAPLPTRVTRVAQALEAVLAGD